MQSKSKAQNAESRIYNAVFDVNLFGRSVQRKSKKAKSKTDTAKGKKGYRHRFQKVKCEGIKVSADIHPNEMKKEVAGIWLCACKKCVLENVWQE